METMCDFIALDGNEIFVGCLTADMLANSIAKELYGDCPECGSPVIDGRCINQSRHNGGV